MAKRKKKKPGTALVPYNPDKMTFDKATSWGERLIPKRLKKIKEAVQKVKTTISEAAKRRAATKAEANRVTTIHGEEKGFTKMETKTSPQYTKTTEATKTKPGVTEGAYKKGSAAKKAQKETLSRIPVGKKGKVRPGKTPVTTVTPSDKWEKQIEKIRNSDMTMKQKKDAIYEVNKKKKTAGMETGRKDRQTEVLKTEEGQKKYQQSRETKMDIGKQRKKRKKEEDEVRKYISELTKR